MRDVTLCMAYYENAGMLQRHYDLIATFPKELRSHLTMIVVDDGSPTKPAFKIKSPPVRTRIFRMGVDIPWNQDACRNLAVHHVKTPWVLITDMDHMVPYLTWVHVMNAELDEKTAYKFMRVNDVKHDGGQPYKPHPNSFILTKALYDKVGGYDERFAGIYGTDGRFRNMLNTVGYIQELPVPIIRVPREVTPDASTTQYPRKTDESERLKIKVNGEITRSGQYKPKTLTFPWSEI